MKIDLFGGTGFVGGNYKRMFPELTNVHEREDDIPVFKDVLYMISTTSNYNVFDDVYVDVSTNLTKMLKVLSNCKDRDIVFNFVSSWFVYGGVDLPAREESYCNPKGFYSITKKCAEDLLISYCQTFGIKYRILRLCNVYGPGDSGVSSKKNALQYLINKIKAGEPIGLYHGGEFVRDYMHVSDVCRAINLCVSCSAVGEIINIASGIPQNFREIIDFAMIETGSKSEVASIDASDFHKTVQVRDMYLDCSKLRGLGFRPQVSIEQGIRDLLVQ